MKIISNDIFFAQIEELLAEGQSVVIRVKGFSMRPFMRSDRTQVRIAPATASVREEFKVKDVVLFRYRGRHVLHRIRHIDGDSLTLAGDGNYHIWEHCHREDVVGIVTDIITLSGHSIPCSSNRWHLRSTLWLALPQLARRIILGILWRLGFK